LDDEAAPGVVVDASGQLVVRIETSPVNFGHWYCYDQNGYGYYNLYGRVSIHFTEAKRLREPVKILPATSSSGTSTTGRITAVVGASYSQVEFPKETIPSVFTILVIFKFVFDPYSTLLLHLIHLSHRKLCRFTGPPNLTPGSCSETGIISSDGKIH
jgi:hypothetical protein